MGFWQKWLSRKQPWIREPELEELGPSKALVIGAAGFIGRHVVAELVAQGYEVTSADLRPDPEQPNPIEVDVTDSFSLNRAADSTRFVYRFGRYPPNVTINLAGLVSGSEGRLFEVNTESLYRIRSMRDVYRVVSIGSAAEYGYPLSERVDEGHPCDPLSDYGKSKLRATQDRGDAIVVRPSSVVGRGMGSRSLFGHILACLQRGETEIVVSSCDVVRDYLSARDVARGIVLAARDGIEGEIYNLGSGVPTKLSEAVPVIKDITGIEFKLVERPRADEIVRFVLDPSKAKAKLGFEAEDDLESMLRAAWEGVQS